MGAAIYAASEAEGAASAGESGDATGEGDDDVVDAEIVDEETPADGTDGESK
jgi:molecular chaperone DnaK